MMTTAAYNEEGIAVIIGDLLTFTILGSVQVLGTSETMHPSITLAAACRSLRIAIKFGFTIYKLFV